MQPQSIDRDVILSRVRDLSSQVYYQQQLKCIAAEQVQLAATDLKPAGHFFYDGKNWAPNEYQGYAVVSMVNNNPGNDGLAPLLANIQNELRYHLQPVNGFYMLPAESFHQTIANTLSANRFKDNILNAGLEMAYPRYIDDAFKNTVVTRQQKPIRMRLVGLGLFGTAVGVLGVFETDADYKRITDFRSGFYEDPQLNRLDVKMTRPFIGHITLAYAEQKLNKNQRSHLANTINELNEQVFVAKHYFHISHTELRRYNHLAEFNTATGYPTYHFTL